MTMKSSLSLLSSDSPVFHLLKVDVKPELSAQVKTGPADLSAPNQMLSPRASFLMKLFVSSSGIEGR